MSPVAEALDGDRSWPDHLGEPLLEIRWYDSTPDLDGQGFNRFLTVFADFLLDKRRPRVLVDLHGLQDGPGQDGPRLA